MSSIRVVGLGSAVLDVLARIEQMPTWEHPGSLVDLDIDGGGPVATAMVAVQRLGVHAGMVGTYGSNRVGQIKLQTLIENGVDVSRMVQRPGAEGQACIAFVEAATGERVFSGLRRFLQAPLTVDELDRDYITSAEYLHLDGRHAAAALEAARWMHAAGRRVMLDGTATRGGWAIAPEMCALVENCDVLICGAGFGPDLTGLDDVWEIGRAILAMGPTIVVQTEGREGAYTVTREEQFHTPSFEVEVVDTTGCGDVFHGAYIVGLLEGWDLHQTAQFASAVSALKATRLGGRAGIPTLERTLAFLAERGIELPLSAERS
jgi:sulfofructose kinase